MKFKQVFVVTGSMQFPLDMLRYDACFPKSEEDSHEMARATSSGDPGSWSITLMRYVELKAELPSVGRWKSFGVNVVNSSIETSRI